jgi:hypothetical protein
VSLSCQPAFEESGKRFFYLKKPKESNKKYSEEL